MQFSYDIFLQWQEPLSGDPGDPSKQLSGGGDLRSNAEVFSVTWMSSVAINALSQIRSASMSLSSASSIYLFQKYPIYKETHCLSSGFKKSVAFLTLPCADILSCNGIPHADLVLASRKFTNEAVNQRNQMLARTRQYERRDGIIPVEFEAGG